MPGRVRKYLQFASIGAADAWSGLEASTTCWIWICRCLVGVGSICNLLDMNLQMPGRGWKHLQLAGIGFADAYPGFGSICNLLDMNLQMPGQVRKYLQFASIGAVDAWSGSEVSTTCWI